MNDFFTRYGFKIQVNEDLKTKVFAKYKGKTVFDTGMFYAPYVPLQTVNTMQNDKVIKQGEIWGWTTFVIVTDRQILLDWCRENLGKQHRGIYLAGFGIWIGNRGRWRHDGRQLHEIGLSDNYTRIWLHRDEDIALFKMRWG